MCITFLSVIGGISRPAACCGGFRSRRACGHKVAGARGILSRHQVRATDYPRTSKTPTGGASGAETCVSARWGNARAWPAAARRNSSPRETELFRVEAIARIHAPTRHFDPRAARPPFHSSHRPEATLRPTVSGRKDPQNPHSWTLTRSAASLRRAPGGCGRAGMGSVSWSGAMRPLCLSASWPSLPG